MLNARLEVKNPLLAMTRMPTMMHTSPEIVLFLALLCAKP
jgi:hypothetical protein